MLLATTKPKSYRDVTAGATGATSVAPKFSDALTLFQPEGTDSAQHQRGCTKNFPWLHLCINGKQMASSPLVFFHQL